MTSTQENLFAPMDMISTVEERLENKILDKILFEFC